MTGRRDRILIAVGGLMVLASLVLPLRDYRPLETGGYVQAVTTDSAVVAWTAAEPAPASLQVRCYGVPVFDEAEPEPARRHEFHVAGLDPGLEYDWELRRAQDELVGRGRFKTRSARDESPVRFAVVGDSGGQPWWVHGRRMPLFQDLGLDRALAPRGTLVAIGEALRALRPDFWLHVGDVVYPAGAQHDYETGFFRPFAALLRDAPCYPVLGNHDVMVDEGAAFRANFVLPGGSDEHFTFRDGPLRVIGLDLNGPVGPDHSSIVFLRRTLEQATEPWIVVMSHYPVRSAYRENPREDLAEHYVPLCREYGVDLLLAGHDHNYQRFGEPGELIEVVSGGGGKSLYEIEYPTDDLAAAARAYHVTLVEIRGPTLRLTARDLAGRTIDDFTIDKRRLLQQGFAGRAERIDRLRALLD